MWENRNQEEKKMEMIPVESSNIAAIDYNPETKILRIQFHKRNSIYEYAAVPPETHKALMEADSKGAFFQRNILKVFVGRKVV